MLKREKVSSLITLKEAAALKGIKPPTLRDAVRRGTVVTTEDERRNVLIDLIHPVNQIYFGGDRVKKHLTEIGYLAPEPAPKKSAHNAARPQTAIGDSEDDDLEASTLPIEKLRQDIRLKRTQADLKALEYSNKIGLLIDHESMIKKFAPFVDVITTELIALPEGVSDMIVSLAHSDDDPEKAVEKFLSDYIEKIILNAKAAATKVTEPPHGVLYSVTEDE